MAYRLTVSDKITLRVAFALPDGEVDKNFEFVATAKRVAPITNDEIITEYLLKRAEMAVDRWIGDALLVDDSGVPVVGPEALAFLFANVGFVHLEVLKAYAEATNARAKLGNSALSAAS